MMALEKAVPQQLRSSLDGALTSQPRADLEKDFRHKFVEDKRYANCLVRFKALAESAIDQMPNVELVDATTIVAPSPATAAVVQRLNTIERMCRTRGVARSAGKVLVRLVGEANAETR